MVILRSKIVILGDPAVGKTSIVQMFHSNGSVFPAKYVMTLGADLEVKMVKIPDTNSSVEFYIFDISGQSIYENSLDKYLENANMFMLVYDVTDEKSFRNCTEWLKLAKKVRAPGRPIRGVLVANKIDVEENMVVVKEAQGQSFARTHGLEFFQVSAQKYRDVDAPFTFLANNYYKSYDDKTKVLSLPY